MYASARALGGVRGELLAAQHVGQLGDQGRADKHLDVPVEDCIHDGPCDPAPVLLCSGATKTIVWPGEC